MKYIVTLSVATPVESMNFLFTVCHDSLQALLNTAAQRLPQRNAVFQVGLLERNQRFLRRPQRRCAVSTVR